MVSVGSPHCQSEEETSLCENTIFKPTVGLYVRRGAGLPDLADSKRWAFDGIAAQGETGPGKYSIDALLGIAAP
jgi:hypothetical protein